MNQMHSYVLALGCNRLAPGYASLPALIDGAISRIGARAGTIVATSPLYVTRPLGPSMRNYCNAAVILKSDIAPLRLLAICKQIERDIGRRRGRVWGARPVDIDIIFWSGGAMMTRVLTIPHRHWMQRRFVTDPVCAIAADWFVPGTGRRVRHIAHQLTRNAPIAVDRWPLRH